jgi:uncharacterized protein (TIGR02001 family)
MNKKTILAAALVTTAAFPAVSMAEASANVGWVSEYIFRGVFQEDSSAYAGIDYAHDSGFYLGTWGADVGLGLETDLYFGYTGGEDFTYKVGFTGYYYTDDFDDTYQEINLGIGYGIFALDVAIGEWDGFGTPLDYTFTSITISPEKGPYYKFGVWGDDYPDVVLVGPSGDAEYFEIGYAYSLDDHGVDLSFALTYSDDLVVGNVDDFASAEAAGDYAVVFGAKKSFGIGGE